MKKLLYLIVSLLSLASVVNAIEYHPFPTSNAAWQIRYWIGPGYPYVYYYYFMGSNNNDTIINGNTYGKLFEVEPGPNTYYLGCLREINSSQVYFVPKDSSNEYLLFDYSKNAGDVVNFFGYSPAAGLINFNLMVQIKDSVLIANKYQRRLQLDNGTVWIEGIGNQWGLLENFAFSVSGTTQLLCMSYNDTTWMEGSYSLGACSLILIGIPENLMENNFEIYPNPANDNFTIKSNLQNQFSKIEIYNITGEIVYSDAIVQKEQLIKCELFPSGIYIIKSNVQGKLYIRKLIVHHNFH